MIFILIPKRIEEKNKLKTKKTILKHRTLNKITYQMNNVKDSQKKTVNMI